MTESTLIQVLPEARVFGETARRDSWWLQPLLIFLGLGAFVDRGLGVVAAAPGEGQRRRSGQGDEDAGAAGPATVRDGAR